MRRGLVGPRSSAEQMGCAATGEPCLPASPRDPLVKPIPVPGQPSSNPSRAPRRAGGQKLSQELESCAAVSFAVCRRPDDVAQAGGTRGYSFRQHPRAGGRHRSRFPLREPVHDHPSLGGSADVLSPLSVGSCLCRRLRTRQLGNARSWASWGAARNRSFRASESLAANASISARARPQASSAPASSPAA
jgi:hypothetical protein